MRLGVTMFATDRAMAVPELAVEAERRGFASLYLPEHTHIPVSRTTPPPTGDAALPEEYARTLDPLIALAAAASVTSRIVLGTGVSLIAEREPIVTAKAVATLDNLSGGRVALGVGFGWNREEAADHGVRWETRRARAREHVLAMRALWEREEASYEGEFVRFTPSWAWPKPARRIPVLLGGAPGPTLFRHIAEYGDGWLPIGGAGVREALPALRDACARVGRAPVPVIPFGTEPTPGKLDYYASLGIEEVVLRLPAGPRDEVLPILDAYADTYLSIHLGRTRVTRRGSRLP
ncbi:LLM class F420-dependent oxidoreductase [Actinoallomurus soli]|uniref:LLM class F420-dependent oxidoreductase n=1 Tax=Actinoallomurus soli TaxID=2952535 RepID=UPI0020929CC5|nr:LLM class F420-dependent oxidoreductase [Actinoallomurus soli]MCO5971149.1 LLM class F420-dependent oxidoreductase [Actinoallomurus soli]